MNFTGPLEDRIAIRELCDQYCDGAMCRDMEIWGDAWAEDAEWVRSDATVKGRDAIVASCLTLMESFSTGIFFRNQGRLHVDGDRASGRCYHIEVFEFADGPRSFLTYYDDDYVKRNGRWYILKRTLNVMKTGLI